MSTVITEDQEISNTLSNVEVPETIEDHHQPQMTIAIRPDELFVQPTIPADSTSPMSTCQTQFAITPTITVVCPKEEPKEREDVNECTESELELSVTTAQIEVPVHDPDSLYGAMDEMSPTTEEYQECCAPDDFQLEGEILARGCVAPAPTPAPSIAPLAEFEGDPADDDPETDANERDFEEACAEMAPIEPIVVIQTVATVVAPKRLHRKKRSADGSGVAGGGPKEGSVSRQPSEEVAGHNTVCPWEDE